MRWYGQRWMTRWVCGLLLLAGLGAGAVPVRAGIAPENVAVVVNGESEPSRQVADEYVRLRGIPAGNVIALTGLPDREKLTVDDFRQHILLPVLKSLEERGLTPQIDVIAYSVEIPTAIDVRSDLGPRKLPQIFTPVASINGLTFLYQLVLAKDPRYLDLNANFYARRVLPVTADTPWTMEEQQRYAEMLMKLRQHLQAKRPAPGETEPKAVDPEAQAALLKDVVTVFEELTKAHPAASELHYNRACALAQLDQPEAAITALAAAVKAGWWNHRHAATDEDLKSLRERDDFKALLARMQTVDFEVQPALGFRAAQRWLPNGTRTTDERAPRYLLSTVLACTTGRGNTLEEALTQLRQATAADGTRPSGTIYFERNGDVRSTTREWAFRNAARKLKSLGVEAIIEEGVLPQQKADVAGAVIGTANFDWSKSGSVIRPGAIVEHLTSFGGMLAQGAGQTPLTEFLKHGAAGSSGTVTEPYAIQAKFPSPFVHVHYASGCTLAEAFYQSVTGPYQLLIVGDPLCQPWRKDFTLTVEGVPSTETVAGTLTLSPRTTSNDDIQAAEYELYLAGKRIRTAKPDEPLRWDTTGSADGLHEVTLLARGNDAVQSVARVTWKLHVPNAAK